MKRKTNLQKYEEIEKIMKKVIPMMIRYLENLKKFEENREIYKKEFYPMKRMIKEVLDNQPMTYRNQPYKAYTELQEVFAEHFINFNAYRSDREKNVNIKRKLKTLSNKIRKINESHARKLSEYSDLIRTDLRKRPRVEGLLKNLPPIKASGYKYFESGFNESYSYELNIKLADEIIHARRTLIEEWGYQGTFNAFDRVVKAYDSLSKYMYEYFYQLGGTPKNYHGRG